MATAIITKIERILVADNREVFLSRKVFVGKLKGTDRVVKLDPLYTPPPRLRCYEYRDKKKCHYGPRDSHFHAASM